MWTARALWILTFVVVSLALDSGAILTAWWVAAGVVLISLVAGGPIALTITRMLTPSAIAVSVAALTLDGSAVAGATAFACGALATLMAFQAETGEAMIQVSAYGDERRLPLRPPAAMQPFIIVSWLLWFATIFVGVVLLEHGQRLIGFILMGIGAVLTLPVARRLHRFSCRWLVSVPAGVVVHDSLLLGETLLVLRPNVSSAHLALADTMAADLTGPAAGHALELEFHDDVTVVLSATPKNPKGTAIHARAVLVAPSRPGRALMALAERKIRVA